MKYKIFIVFGICIHILILTQSLLPASLSSDQSGVIVDILHPFVLNLGISIDVQTFSLIVRKTAHFTEFFLLGVFWYIIYAKYFKSVKLIGVVLIHGFFTAVLDETVQLFVDGRSGEVLDVFIDFCGVLFACFIVSITIEMTNYFKLKRRTIK